MKQMIYSVFDSKAEAFMTPFFAPTRGVALRSFQEAASTAGHEFHKHASDYQLFELGAFEDQGAVIEAHASPVPLCPAQEYLEDKG